MPVPKSRPVAPFLRKGIGSGVRRIPPRVLARALRAGGAHVPGSPHGLVTWIVLVDPREQRALPETLRALCGQDYRSLEVLIAPYGADVAGDLVTSGTGGDPRFRVLATSVDLAGAAAAGARAATGVALGFVRGCDWLEAHATIALAATLGRENVVATGRMLQRGRVDRWREPVTGGLDLVLGASLFRTRAWRRHGWLVENEEDWWCSKAVAAALAVGPAASLDVRLVRHAEDHGRRPFAAEPSALADLSAWVDTAERVRVLLKGTEYEAAWRIQVLARHLPRFLVEAERPETGWSELVTLAAQHRAQAAALEGDVPVLPRTLVYLAAEDRRRDLESLWAWARIHEATMTAQVGAEGVIARWPPLTTPQHTDGVPVPEQVLRLTDEESALRYRVHRSHHGGIELFLALAHLDLSTPEVEVRVTAGARELPVRPLAALEARRWAQDPSAEPAALWVAGVEPGAVLKVRVRVRTDAGEVRRSVGITVAARPRPAPGGARLVEATLVEGALVLSGQGIERVVATGPVPVTSHVSTPGELVLDRRRSAFGRLVALPTGRYRLRHPDGLSADDGLAPELPLELHDETHRVQVVRVSEGIDLLIGPPFAAVEVGPRAQELLRRDYRAAARSTPVRTGVWYFESYAGADATDSPAAICAEVRRRHPDADLVWGVRDHSASVPVGVRSVLLYSRAWWDLLATAQFVVTNTELEEWFVPRPEQTVLQTFHGYPSKSMGMAQWRALDLPPSRIAEQRRRGVETWDLILTPTPTATRHYREQYGWEGPVADRGYPRNDDLANPTSPAALTRRERTRDLLRIAPAQQAVLYAPTWRDTLASRPRQAAMPEFLDLDRAAARLGADHVLLVRGHRFNQTDADAQRPGAARIVDVTAYPEVNDLILASDLAVLDYSSMRFDVALAGRPMVFLVPDLADYTDGTRGFLDPFEETAPGPLVSDTDAVIRALTDVTALATARERTLVEFNARWNPYADGHASARVVDAAEAVAEGTLR